MKKQILVVAFSLATTLQAQIQLTTSDMNYTTSGGSVVSIHDPSVVLHNGTYTVWGSHLGVATSKDLINWTPQHADNNTFRKLASQGATTSTACGFADAFNTQQVTKIKNYKGEEVNFPNFDAEAYCNRYAADRNTWVNGNMWAPDIIYNPTMKKWCMYLSLNGDHWSSIIILLTGNSATGPFTYQGPVVMGGFDGQTRNGVAAPKFAETDYEIATGEKSIPSRYIRKDNGTYWPNCIDPCVFYDEEGELWMSYGSWSGGIFMLKLDKETGLRDYTHTYPSDYASAGANGVSDPYFGKKIAGGYYVSGEGSYIQHIGKYYYLFMSYGGFAPGGYDGNGNPQGGYDMRIFRSEKPDGPYVDANGTVATYTRYNLNFGPTANDNRGVRLMGAYNNWGELQNVGERSQGHNSACVDENGRAFVVYHTKFNDGTAGHQVRVHQLFTNKNGWLLAAPFCYTGEEQTDATMANECEWTQEQLCGDYQVMIQPYKQNYAEFEESTPVTITLSADGKVSGAYTGTWTLTEGTSQMTLKVGGTTFNGVFCKQAINGATKANYKTSSLQAIAFTAVCDVKGNTSTGVPVWGYKLEPKSAMSYNYKNHSIGVKAGQIVSSNLKLMFPTNHNVLLNWTSSDPSIISETGKYNPAGLTESTPIDLTVKMECGEYFWTQTYNVRAKEEGELDGDCLSGLVAYYNFDEKPTYNQYKAPSAEDFDRVIYGKWGNGTTPAFESDYERNGQYIHQYFGANAQNSFSRMPNPLLGQQTADSEQLTGFTISAWVKRNDANTWDALWGFFNTTNATNTASARLYLTGNSYLGFNDANGNFFDLNHPDTKVIDNIPVGEWALVTLTVGPENGIRLYINGSNKTISNISTSYATSGSSTTTKIKSLPLADIISKVSQLKYLYLGNGSFWGSADACFDDLMVYNRELTVTDVRTLNTMCNRVSDFTKGENGTGIEEHLSAPYPSSQHGIFDLTGRKLSTPTPRGIYIVNGKKVVK
ncbi:MAG: family 43 glycosylhydrolase [Bacteroidaceae bacterium]|nr:family 43 glycosylhydrolase [Bacteroidaceae bacterium]